MFVYDGNHLETKAVGFGAAISDSYYTSNLMDMYAAQSQAVVGGIGPLRAYMLVPWLFRAVTWRANNISRMPYVFQVGGQEMDVKDPTYSSLFKGFKQRLWMVEAQLVIAGAAYELLEANALGRNVTPRTLLSAFVTSRYDEKGLTHFQHAGANTATVPTTIPLEKMLWWWRPNFSSEVQPGPGEAMVALGAASMLYALDAFAANFFNRGGVPVWLFELPPSTKDTEKESFQNWLNRSVNGVRNAFRMIAFRTTGIKATRLGDNVRDTRAPELTEEQRESVAIALGVPPNVLSGNYKYATADSEYVGFITQTIIPEAEIIFERYNEQFFSRFDAEIIPQPEKLDVMQSVQLAQAGTLKELTGGKAIFTVDEARDWLGMEAMEIEEEPEEIPIPPFAPGGEPTPVEEVRPEVIEALSTWRQMARAAVRKGASADVPVPAIIPYALMRAIDTELKTASTMRAVNRTFERHWPRPANKSQTQAIEKLTEEIKLARAALAAAPPEPAPIHLAQVNVQAGAPTEALAAAISNLPETVGAQASHQTEILAKALGDSLAGLPPTQVTAMIDTAPLAQAITEMAQALIEQKPPVVKNEINLPRIREQRSRVLRDTQTDQIEGQVTKFEYEE